MYVAIYGKIGSGKSSVMELLRKKGKRTCSCDEIYKNVVVHSPDYIEAIDINFPGVVKDGEIDLPALAKVVYNDKVQLAKLNSIAHPQIRACLRRILDGFPEAYAEVPLLVESNWQDMFDKCVYVKADPSVRAERVKERDGKTEEQVAQVDSHRANDALLEINADYILENNGTLADLALAVDDMLAALKKDEEDEIKAEKKKKRQERQAAKQAMQELSERMEEGEEEQQEESQADEGGEGGEQ